MNEERLECWKCGESLSDMLLPLGRADECPRCNTDLHVCRLCRFYDPAVANACREPIAEPVGNKERANFCGYFTLRAGAHAGSAGKDAAAASALNDLFGLGNRSDGAPDQGDSDPARDELNRLFGLNDGTDD